MTVETINSEVMYVTGGPVFPVPFRFQQAGDISAVLTKADESTETLSPSQYAITGAGDQSGGSLTSSYAASALAAGGASLTIARVMSQVQLTDLGNHYAEQSIAEGSDGDGYFLQEGSGAVNRTFQDKMRDTMSAADFGLLGDGADETAKLQLAINACIAQRKVLVGDRSKTYKITSQLNGGSFCYMRDVYIDASAITGTKHVLVFSGAAGSSSALTATAQALSYSLTVANGAIFSADEWVLLTVDTSYYPYPGYNLARGEWVQIRNVTGNVLALTTPLVQSYLPADGGTVRKYNMAEDISLDNVRVTGSGAPSANERGICFRFARDFEVRNCRFTNIDQYALEISNSLKFIVNGNRFRGTFYDGVNGTIFYAIAILDGCQYGIVGSNHGARSRHLVVATAASAGQGRWGQSMFINVHDNVSEDSMSGGAGRSFAYEVHGIGQHQFWSNNIANGCYSFMRIEGGSDIKVIGGGCNGYAYQGMIIGGAGQTVRNIDVRGVTLGNYTAEVGGLSAAIRFETSSVIENVTFDGVKVVGAAVASVGNAISIGASVTSRNNIMKNIDASSGAQESTGTAVTTASAVTGFTFENCKLFGWRQGYSFAVSTSKLLVLGGSLENFSLAATGFGFYSNGDRNICKDVHFRNIALTVRLDALSKNNLAINNTFTDCTTTTPSNAGTGNTVSPNYVV